RFTLSIHSVEPRGGAPYSASAPFVRSIRLYGENCAPSIDHAAAAMAIAAATSVKASRWIHRIGITPSAIHTGGEAQSAATMAMATTPASEPARSTAYAFNGGNWSNRKPTRAP